MSIYDPQPCGTQHEGWECRGGWHECNDCGRGLGTRDNKLEEHAAETCSLCGPVYPTSSCVHDQLRMCPPCTQEVEDRLGPVTKFETKDSGARQEYASGMRRDIQEGKPRFDLLFVPGMPYNEQPLTRWAALLERGATKYGEENWTLADSDEELKRFRASAARHFSQWMAGETDEDHMSATFFNMAAVAYMEWKLGGG